MSPHELIIICQDNSLTVTAGESKNIARDVEVLAEGNSKINLISLNDEAHILDRHILHSLVLAMPAICDYDFRNKRALDIGTGGGLPGIPLKIVMDSLDMT